MDGISIERGEEILAHHTTESSMSHYGQPVWVVEVEDPDPGPAIWRQWNQEGPLEVIEARGGWLICRLPPDPRLWGLIWSDGEFYSDLVVDQDGQFVESLNGTGLHIRGTVQFDPEDPEDLGAIVPGLI